MFTKREQLDILDDHNLFVVFVKDRIIQHICGSDVSFVFSVHTGATGSFRIHSSVRTQHLSKKNITLDLHERLIFHKSTKTLSTYPYYSLQNEKSKVSTFSSVEILNQHSGKFSIQQDKEKKCVLALSCFLVAFGEELHGFGCTQWCT